MLTILLPVIDRITMKSKVWTSLLTFAKHPIWGPLLACVAFASVTTLLSAPDLKNDSKIYFLYGRNWVDTGVYGFKAGTPDMGREPGYGGFLAAPIFTLDMAAKLISNGPFSEETYLKWIVFVQSSFAFFAFYLLALKSGIDRRLGWMFLMLSLFSPTLWGSHTVIYSETLAITWIVLFVWALKRSMDRTLSWAILAGIFWGLAILTKSYLNYSVYLMFLAGLILLLVRASPPSLKTFGKSLIIVSMIGFTFNAGWNLRNKIQLGEQAGSARLCNAVAGKILRVESFKIPQDLPKAVVAAIGTNLCFEIYGPAECEKFIIEGADKIGFAIWQKYVDQPLSYRDAEKAILRDILPQYFNKPFHQIVGSVIEGIRISFLETPQRFETPYRLINLFPKIWHFAGSLLVWILFLLGFSAFYKRSFALDLSTRLMLGTGLGLIIYHYAVMTQVTNNPRYIYPVLPFFYAFAALGIIQLRLGLFSHHDKVV